VTLFDPNFDISPAWGVLPWLAAPLLALVVLRRWGGTPVHRARHWTLWVCRTSALLVLVVLLLNPVHVSVTPAPTHRPEVHVLLDASQSMRLGTPSSRWEEATTLLRDALQRQESHADVRVHRFGERFAAVDLSAFTSGGELAAPTDADTQLGAAFRQLLGRLGRDAPSAVVVISDGRVRDPDKLDEMAAPWRQRRIPVHVVPVGRAAEGGDVAIVAALAPAKARKQAQITVNVFLRSFGFAGKRVELQLHALADNGTVRRTLTTLPVTLQDGVQPLSVAFRMEPDLKKLRLNVTQLPGDLAPANNEFPLEIELDRTKIRVLYLEGSDAGAFVRPNQQRLDEDDSDAPYAPFRDALLADPDVQCTVYHVSGAGMPRRVLPPAQAYMGTAFPKTAAELLAYDALVLSNVPSGALSDEVLGWVEEWIGKRGGGLLMAGGPRAFGAGSWSGTAIERMLPVEFLGTPDWDGSGSVPEPTGADLHPVWRLFEDERATRAALRALPESPGRNNWVRVKPQSGTLLGAQKANLAGGPVPLLAVGAYGRGRTMALATPLSGGLASQFTRQWGEAGDNRYFARFARNLIYWLTEDSAIGRRRLVATTDKRFYRPGETVSIAAATYDESATRTGRYQVKALLEPKQLDGPGLPPSPVKWPAGRPRTSGKTGPLAEWGEDEIELNLDPQTKDHSLALPLVEALPHGTGGVAFKLELTAYEGATQIDSSSLDVQVLSDPHEQQNPLPDRAFLVALAAATGGRELTDSASLADALKALSVPGGQETVHRTPLWSRDWLLGVLLGLLATEWFLRRWLGLA
jgi:uncharacterized membrane protein